MTEVPRRRRSDIETEPSTLEVLLGQTLTALMASAASTTQLAASQAQLVAELRASTDEARLQRLAMSAVVDLGHGHLRRVGEREKANRTLLVRAGAAAWGVLKGPIGGILTAVGLWIAAWYLVMPQQSEANQRPPAPVPTEPRAAIKP